MPVAVTVFLKLNLFENKIALKNDEVSEEVSVHSICLCLIGAKFFQYKNIHIAIYTHSQFRIYGSY